MEILFWRHQTAAQARKCTCTLYLRVTINGKRADLGSTFIKCRYEHFDSDVQSVLSPDPHAMLKNQAIVEIQTDLLLLNKDLARKGKAVTAALIKSEYLKKDSESHTLQQVWEIYEAAWLDNANNSNNTLRPYSNAYRRIQEFLKSRKWHNLTVDELELTHYYAFQRYMKDKGNKYSYIAKTLQVFCYLTEFAKQKGLSLTDPLVDVKVKSADFDDPIFLNQFQFEAWCNFQFRGKQAQEAADVFIVLARTAFYNQDLVTFLKSPEMYLKKDADGNEWLYKKRSKTDNTAKIPVYAFPELLEIVKKYGGWQHLPRKQDQKLNDWLKICAAQINITLPANEQIHEALCNKHARKTFSDWWINEKGRTTESLLPIMGRTSDRGLEVYVRPDERAIRHQLAL